MFEVGKLSDESLDSFLLELEKVSLECSSRDLMMFGAVPCLIPIVSIFGVCLIPHLYCNSHLHLKILSG